MIKIHLCGAVFWTTETGWYYIDNAMRNINQMTKKLFFSMPFDMPTSGLKG